MKAILVIDDDRGIREALGELLSGDYDVFIAKDGEEGISLIDEKQPDLVISDLVMPKKGGGEVLLHVKRYYSTMKIIIMTAGGLSEMEKDLYSSGGCDAFLAKPSSNEAILAKVKELLGE